MSLYIGLMSGTSMDGIDAAVIDVETKTFLGGITRAYDRDIEKQLVAFLALNTVTPSALWQLHTLLGRQFAAAALEVMSHLKLSAQDIKAIGSHGQTISHDATANIPYTIQLGCPHSISEITGITTVADFRTRDLLVGGKGAPFAPLYHHALWGSEQDKLAVANIGGIANVTFFGLNGHTYGYDVGPGNCLLDAWILDQTGASYDADGAFAAKGSVIPELLSELLCDDYFKQASPKSICKSYFSLDWLRTKLQTAYAPEDVQASLTELTAISIAKAVLDSAKSVPRLAICGGGVHNLVLLQRLQALLPETKVISTQALGVDPDYLEAMMFAWLAHQTMTATKLDLRHITGAKKPAILGAIYPI